MRNCQFASRYQFDHDLHEIRVESSLIPHAAGLALVLSIVHIVVDLHPDYSSAKTIPGIAYAGNARFIPAYGKVFLQEFALAAKHFDPGEQINLLLIPMLQRHDVAVGVVELTVFQCHIALLKWYDIVCVYEIPALILHNKSDDLAQVVVIV